VYAGPDFYTYFTNNPGQIGPDHVHPNGAGYAAMGSQWASVLNGNL
jgi:lysophospholipase L1-like esterase